MSMDKMKKEYIEKTFTDWNKLKMEGIWFSGIRGEGEYKEWHRNGQLSAHELYKDGEIIENYLK